MARPRTVFITGASSGLGAALARQYAAQGATVGLFARRRAELDALAAALPAGRAVGLRRRRARCRRARSRRCRFHRALRRSRRRHRQRRNLARRIDGARGGSADVPRGASTPTSSASSTRSRRSSRRCGRARRGALVGIASIAGFRGLAGIGRLFGVEGRGHRLSREPAHRAARHRRRRAHDLPRLHRDADDRDESLSDAVPARRGRGRAADRRARSSAGKRFYVLPWPMAIVGRVLRMLPRPIYDALFAHAPRKPRQSG